MKPIKIIQMAWIIEVAACIIFSMILVWISHTSISYWIAIFPQFAILIGGQGAVAMGGPALKKKLDNSRKQIENGK